MSETPASPHAPRLAVVEQIVEGLDPEVLEDTEAVVDHVLHELGPTLVSDVARQLARGTTLFVLQRLDFMAGRAPRRFSEEDQRLFGASLLNAGEYQHDKWPDM